MNEQMLEEWLQRIDCKAPRIFAIERSMPSRCRLLHPRDGHDELETDDDRNAILENSE